jgi:hypothetical protein
MIDPVDCAETSTAHNSTHIVESEDNIAFSPDRRHRSFRGVQNDLILAEREGRDNDFINGEQATEHSKQLPKHQNSVIILTAGSEEIELEAKLTG